MSRYNPIGIADEFRIGARLVEIYPVLINRITGRVGI